MSAGHGAPAPDAGAGRMRWPLLLLLAVVAVLPDPAALLPLRSYYFRDLGIAFLPWRLFAADELRRGRLAAWNPFDFEGSFLGPALYPPELIHALWPAPEFVSWLLTLHLPLAALAAYWLARELGATRAGGFVAGAAFALGGLAQSSVNLYVYLQALALAPLAAGWLRRAALGGGREVVVAAACVAAALSTLAVEFAAQAIALGLALGLLASSTRAALLRLAAACLLAAALAGLPVALTLGFLPETVRGTGFERDVALANSLHPAVLGQVLLPRLFGEVSAPAEGWWGGRFFTKGLPYFLSVYEGPVLLALAALGAAFGPRRLRLALLSAAALGLAVALGPWGGLSEWLLRLPFAGALRFPSKALLLPHLSLALLAAFGAGALARAPGAWRGLALLQLPVATVAAGALALAVLRPEAAAAWLAAPAGLHAALARALREDAAILLALALAVLLLALGACRGRLAPALALPLVAALGVADLARAGAGFNPQVDRSYFELLPELRALRLADAERGRVFSFGVEHSPAFRRFLAGGGRGLTLAASFVNRQMLAPWTNLPDRVETPEGGDPALAVPRPRELAPVDFAPGTVARLVPWLRNAAVGRVLSLDPLEAPELRLVSRVPAGPPGLLIHVYALEPPPVRASVSCRSARITDPAAALVHPYSASGAAGEAAVELPLALGCRSGSARRRDWQPDRERWSVAADGPALLVVRASFARGWSASVDGRPTAVLRANGKHRAVVVPAGAHEVAFRYSPPGLEVGVLASLAGCLAAAGLWLRGRR